MITVSQVANTLSPWLGSKLLEQCREECDHVTHLLNIPRERTALSALSQKIAVYLYGCVKRKTNGRMVVLPDGGYPVQMRGDDFSIIADDLLLLIFMDYPVDAEHLLLLQDFAMQQPSLSVLRALYTRFSSLQTSEELDAIAQIARGCHPAFRLRSWLDTTSM